MLAMHAQSELGLTSAESCWAALSSDREGGLVAGPVPGVGLVGSRASLALSSWSGSLAAAGRGAVGLTSLRRLLAASAVAL